MNYIFGGYKCSMLSKKLHGESNKLITSIYSDDKLSECIDLRFLIENNICEIHILGDLVNIPKAQWVVRNNLLFLLYGFDITIYWYDGDLIQENLNAESIAIDCRDNYKLQHDVSMLVYDIPELNQITKILGFTPKFTLDCNGKVYSIDFSKSSIHSLSYLSNNSENEKKIILSILSNMKSLKEINLSFSNLTALPVFDSINKIDLRGNENVDLSNIYKFKNLKHLNISACNIVELPESLVNLNNLSTLLAYKNKISIVNFEKLPTSIKRLSLYRNNISSICLNDRLSPYLIEINLGANPLNKLDIKLFNSRVTNVIIRKVYRKSINLLTTNNLSSVNIISDDYKGNVNIYS